MMRNAFVTPAGIAVPSLTTAQMREVDRVAVEEFGLGVLQMMENAGSILAACVMELAASCSTGQKATVVAGGGGNGGGGLCAARHLRNHGWDVRLILDRDTSSLRGPAERQLQILQAAEVIPTPPGDAEEAIRRADVVVDALIGYSLHGAPKGRTAELIEVCNECTERVLSLDIPSGLDATTGRAPGSKVESKRTLTLALPKTGLASFCGELWVADIGIPPEVYDRIGVRLPLFHGEARMTRLRGRKAGHLPERQQEEER